jgi:hypothetical protein
LLSNLTLGNEKFELRDPNLVFRLKKIQNKWSKVRGKKTFDQKN